MEGFFGRYIVLMDSKGRISLPSKLRPESKKDMVKEPFVLTRGLDGCLALYPQEQWEKIQQRLDTLSFTRKDFRYFSRMLHSAAVAINLDRQGRLLIPAHLQSDAGLTKEVLVIGSYRWIEFWEPNQYQSYLDDYGQSYEEVAEQLFDFQKRQDQ